jgi:HAD superfamily hydrolase (TIGR01509 family)
MARAGVVFDLDGTLVDTNYLHTLAWARSLQDAGEPPVPMSVIHRVIGMGSQRLVTRLLGRPSEEVIEGHSRHFERLRDDVAGFPGAGDLLAAVHARGAKVVLATSAKAKDVEPMLEVVGAPKDAIDHVVHSGDVERSKPEPDVFQAALDGAGLEPATTVAVGDTVWDVEAARRCGLGCVAVLTGGISGSELQEAGAMAVYEDVAELLAGLDASPIGRLLDA